MTTPLEVPVVDLASSSAAADLDAACRTVGFFQVAGHGVRRDVVDTAFAAAEGFFARPLPEKLAWRPPSPDVNRGYAAPGSEGLAYSVGLDRPPDLFEAFNVGPDDTDPAAPWAGRVDFSPNRWPPEPDGFRPAVTAYFAEVRALAHRLTGLFAEALGLVPDFFAGRTDHSTDMLRINRYVRAAAAAPVADQQMGMGAHSDYGIVTVLAADRVPGLQIVGPDGGWVDVMPLEGCFLVNLGDLTATWTNDRWRSTLHRVLPPAPGVGRRSMAFFHDGNFDALVECLPTCTGPGDPPRYPPVTAGEHLLAKLLGPRTLTPSQVTVDTAGGRLGAG